MLLTTHYFVQRNSHGSIATMEVFAAVADSGSFAKAAKAMRLSPAAVTRAITALEDRLGIRLFVRTTRSVRLTEAGARFLADTQRILNEIVEAEEAATGAHTAPRGILHVTAPVLFGRIYVAPILRDFLDVYPSVMANTLFVDRVVNIVEEGLDVAIRIGDLPGFIPDGDLRRFRPARAFCYAVLL